jgi:ABC-2 type transport system ATP-binding protein
MIEVDQLSKIYGNVPAIRDVTFSVEKGEILGFLGPNGAGKTTTMRILSGYLPATSGTARIAGFDVHEYSMAVRKRIGYLPETPPLYPEMKVEQFLTFVASIKGVSAGDRPSRVESAMKRCNLLEKRSVLIRKLSKGFRQRVGIAQAIVHDPPAIILDEPTVGLDPRQIIDVRNLIKSLAGDHTIILSTHILPEVSMTCDRVAIINQGQVVATNTPEELVAQLSGSLRYDVEVSGNITAVEPRLTQLAGVRSVEHSDGESGRSHLKVELEPGHDLGSEIAAIVVKSGLGLHEMRRNQVSLEDVFLKLTMQDVTVTEPEDSSETEPEGSSETVAETESAEPSAVSEP